MLLKKLGIFILLCSTLAISGCSNKNDSELSIISTTFPGYDFVRNITGSEENIELLLKPGTDFHSFDPTPQDIANIENSDIFIYVGSENWVNTILESIDTSEIKVIRLMDYVELETEMIVEGMEHDHDHEEHEEHEHEEHEEHDHEDEGHENHNHVHADNSSLSYEEISMYDEHIWTSIQNSIILIEELTEVLIEVNPDSEDIYEKNSNEYIEKLDQLDHDMEDMIENSVRKEIVVGDKFPFTYFATDYDLTISAAFSGCSSASDASAQTIAFLIDKVNTNNIPVVFHVELSSEIVADAIVEETNTEKLELHSAHNLTIEDFENGLTYYDFMLNNYTNLKKALN